MSTKIFTFPKQKLSYREKTKDWAIDNIKAGITLSDYDPGKIRKTKDEMRLNYDLVSGKFDEKDVDRSLNPQNFKGVHFPAKIQNYPIELTKLDVLKGEELSRPFNWFLRATNDHVVIEKEEREQEEVRGYMANQLDNPNYSEAQMKRDLQKMKKYYAYDYQDEREEMGTRLLQHIWKTQKVPYLTTDAFYDIVTVAEEIYACDIFHGEPHNRKVSPKNISIFGNGESNYIESSMIIIEDSYMSVGSVTDLFYDELSDDQVKQLDEGVQANRLGTNIVLAGPMNMSSEYAMQIGTQLVPLTGGSSDVWHFSGGYDDNGNIRVIRVVWQSKLKVGKLTYYEDGEELYDYVSEDYKINESFGEKIKWEWITEWWQGYRIGNDMFVKMERLPRLGMTFNNPSRIMPPYVGTIYTIGNKAYSLVDRIRPYKYFYNITMTRAEMASARNKGVLAELDLARIPEGWEPDIWMMYAELNGWFITDSFKQGNEGAAMGKLLSNINNRAPSTMNLDSSQVIIASLELARYIKNEINEITGITPQREGSMQNRETLGGINRSLQQSTFITEPYFYIHDNTKLRLLELNLETAKHCYKDQEFSLNIMDDGLIGKVLKVNGKMMSETAYGMYLSDGKDDAELFQYIRQYAHAALQSDTGKFKDIFEIMKSKSIAAVGRKMQEAEDERISEKELDAQKAYESQQAAVESQIKWDQMKFEQEVMIEMRKLENDIVLKQMDLDAARYKSDASTDIERSRIEKDIQVSKDKLQAQLDALKQKNEEFNRKLIQDREKFNKELEMKRKQKVA
jgi:hypothetical protein